MLRLGVVWVFVLGWGNGDVEVFLEKLEDLPYITGLIRQSLEKQLGDENGELEFP